MSALFELRRSESWPAQSGGQFGDNESRKFRGIEEDRRGYSRQSKRERELMLRGSVSGPTENGNMTVSSTTQLSFPIWKKPPQVIHGTVLSYINNVCIPVFGMCAVVPFVIEVQGMHV